MTFHAIMSILLGFVELFYWICVYYSRRNPESRWPGIFLTPIGPRTDVNNMSRKELFKSAGSFFFWGMHFAVILVAGSFVMFKVIGNKSEPPMVLAGILFFGIPIACGICFLGAFYLFIRGVLRSRDYVSR